MLLLLLLIAPAFADHRAVNTHSAGWTELPHSGGDVTIEPARPKPEITQEAVVSPAPELQSVEGLSPEDRALMQPLLERRKAFGAMNSNNPMSEDFQPASVKEKLARQLGFSPEAVAKASNSKALARVAAFVTSPETISDWQKILSTPIRSPWIAVELGWFVLFFILRGWRLSKATGGLKRLFEHAWLYCAFTLGIFVLIPWLVYGKPYLRLLAGAASALFS